MTAVSLPPTSEVVEIPPSVGQATDPAPNVRTKSDRKFRIARLLVLYPVAGYKYSQQATLGSGGFPTLSIQGPNGEGSLHVPQSIAIEGEFFPLEYLGLMLRFVVYGFTTDVEIGQSDGTTSSFGDELKRFAVSAAGRLPIPTGARTGPLDIVGHVGFETQDFLYFETEESSSAMTYREARTEGLAVGVSIRFHLAEAVQIHADLETGIVRGGDIYRSVSGGSTFKIGPGLTFDVRFTHFNRNIALNKSNELGVSESAEITDQVTGMLVGAGWTF